MDIALRQLLWLPALLPLVAALEAWWLIRRGRGYGWGDYWASLGDVAGRVLVTLLTQGGVVGVLLYAVWDHRLATQSMQHPWQWAVLFIGQEFCYYWMHRADHRVRWFWLNHAVHHSPPSYTLASAYRLGWVGKLTGNAVFFAPLVWLGFPVPHVVGALALNLTYQFWLHTELVGRLPAPLEWWLNTPAHHRIHHASNPPYLDCNYGGVLIVFDRLFGSFRREQAGEPPSFGLVEPVNSHNPLRIVLHPWRALWVDMRRARTLAQWLRVVFGPPGYHPPGP